MTLGTSTFVVVGILFLATLAAFVARDVILQPATRQAKASLTVAAWSLVGLWAVSVVWRFEVLG